MIFESLTLNNFRVFAGEHKVDLKPRHNSVHQPRSMILFGGLNGAGKTSILTAIRIALLGRLAFGRQVSGTNYSAQLTELINKAQLASDPTSKAEVTLNLAYRQGGQDYKLQINRSWQQGKTDKLVLFQNGEKLKGLNYEQAQAALYELVPPGVADLFFFDGEQIANLAEDTSGNLLRDAVKRLLGLDLINRLNEDITTYLKKENGKQASQGVQNDIAELEKNNKALLKQAEEEEEAADSIDVQINSINEKIVATELHLKSQGGEWAKSREQEKSHRDKLLKDQQQLEVQLLSELDGCYPMALAPNTMKAVLKQLEQEAEMKEKQAFRKQLECYISSLNKELSFKLSSSAPEALAAIKDSLEEFAPPVKTELTLDLSQRDHQQLDLQITRLSQQAKQRFEQAQSALRRVTTELSHTSDNISRALDDDFIKVTVANLRQLDKEKMALITDYKRHIEEARKLNQERLNNARTLQKHHATLRSDMTFDRATQLACNTQGMLKDFSKELTNVRVKQLEEEFSKAYKRLARKEDLSIHARINPETFDVELIDEQQHRINRKALSAGEKQIYAIAILDALGKVSGKQLPVVIDTPLGRLDSKHRNKLVENYFPEASEQVIILSTDTEVDERFFDILQDDISHGFEIRFNERSKSSELTEGYFWQSSYKEVM